MPVIWRQIERRQRIALGLTTFLLAAAVIGWSYYEYDRWKKWKQINETILAYPAADAESVRLREQQLKKLETFQGDVLPAIQKLADIYGIQLLSFQALHQDKGEYEIELTSTYKNYIQFLNQLDKEFPLSFISIVRMEYNGENINITMRI